jgi:predicted DNA-binding ribbon-helix-helix protein
MNAIALLRSLRKEAHGVDPDTQPGLINRNIRVRGHRTSMRLEASMWDALHEICQRERITLPELCTFAAGAKCAALTLTAALRVLIANYFRDAATEDGHAHAGHGCGTAQRPHPARARSTRKPRADAPAVTLAE